MIWIVYSYKSMKRVVNYWAEEFLFCLISFFLLLFSFNAYSQANPSIEYNSIIENKSLSKNLKTSKIDSLLSQYETQGEYEKLFDDIYSYAVWYYKSGDYKTAINVSNKGIDISKKFKNPHPNRLAGLKNTIGSSYLDLGNYEKAFNAYKNIVETVKIDKRIAEAYHSMAWCKKDQGDYYSAIEYFDLSISKAKDLEDKSYHIEFVINETYNYDQIENKKLKQKGVKSLKQILKLTETDTNYTKVFYPDYKMFILWNIGGLQQEISDSLFEEAEQYYIRALKIAEKHKFKEQIGGLNNALGYICMKQNRPGTLNYLDNALLHIENTELKSICYSNKAFYFANNNRFEEALSNAQEAIGLLAKFDTSDIYNLPTANALKESIYKRELLTALIDKAEIFIMKNKASKQNKDLTVALDLLNLSDELTDIIRLESDNTDSKLFWRTMASRIYTNAVDICYKLNNDEQALYYIEKNKALLLLEDINQKKYINSANIPSQTLQKYNKFKSTITEQTQLLHKSADSTADSLRLVLINSKNNLREFTDSLQTTKYATYFKAINSSKVISLNGAQNSLSDTEVYISYILSDSLGFGIVITKNEKSFFKINNLESLKTLTKSFNNFLVKPLNSKTELKEFDQVAKQLYILLFPKKIEPLTKGKTLIISPDYYLQDIPFEALKKENSNAFLIEDHIISYIYSITFLEENSKLNRTNDKQLLGFAPIDFENNLSRLSNTKNELEAITNILDSEIFYNDLATTDRFKQHLENYDIIHLATHANATDSLRPWIAFKDKLLTLDQLYLTKNSAELVVLSACETGIGELKQGEGVMSLARGFFNTGSNTVISSLWNVNDKSSSDLMANFYAYLKQGQSKNQALHSAKIDYLKNASLSEQSPYYWASFIMIGDTNTINSIQTNHWPFIFLGIAVFILALFFFFKFKK